MDTFKKILKWGAATIGIAFITLVIIRVPYVYNLEKTNEQVAIIHATKLTLADVMGNNLPPDPGADADKTIQGIDANKNGIRDDVESAIFKEYPNSAKTRMPLLQYALARQIQMTLPIVNEKTVTATVEDTNSKAELCLWTLSSRFNMDKFLADMDKYESFVKDYQINTEQRKKYINDLYEYLRSYSSSNEGCDIDPATLPN